MSKIKLPKFCSAERTGSNSGIELLVFHCFALPTPKMLSVFKKTGTSTHYLIQRNGKILSLVPENRVAYHAGLSSWRNFPEKINQHSIGIEIQNPKMGEIRYTQAQIQSVIKLSKHLIKKYHIPPENIVGHSDIAPIRKPDPGRLFPWQELAEHGIGLYPPKSNSTPIKLSETEIKQYLSQIGYDTTDLKATLYAFIKRFLPDKTPANPHVIRQEATVFQYWLGTQKSEITAKLKNAPCIYPENMIESQADFSVFTALLQTVLLYARKKR